MKERELDLLSDTVNTLQKKLINKNNIVKKQQEHINELTNLHHEKYMNEIDALKQTNQVLMKQKKTLEKSHQQLDHIVDSYERFNPKSILELLYDKLSLSNYRSFYLANPLNRKYLLTKKNAKSSSQQTVINKIELYGYVKRRQNIFIDMDGELYAIKRYPKINIKSGDAVAARLNEDQTVDIYWVYETEKIMKVDTQLSKRNKQLKLNRQARQFDHLGDYKVLIITANEGNKYQQFLRNHGLVATWFDPYEKSPVHAEQQMVSHDIVLICLDSIPHYITNLIGKNSGVKYQFLKNHNEEIIYNRVRLIIEQYLRVDE